MQELLSVNERYHDLLEKRQRERHELEAANAEAHRLRAALGASEQRVTTLTTEQARLAGALRELSEAKELQAQRCMATEDSAAQLSRHAQDATQQIVALQHELGAAVRRAEEAERLAGHQFQRGFDEAAAKLQKQNESGMRLAQERAQETAQQAFEFGRTQRASEESAALLREQAQRRLLLHRAEESRLQQKELERQLKAREAASAAAERSQRALSERLRGVRSDKNALADQLRATRTAHEHDLLHFQVLSFYIRLYDYYITTLLHSRTSTPSPTSRRWRRRSASRARSTPRSPPRAASPRAARSGATARRREAAAPPQSVPRVPRLTWLLGAARPRPCGRTRRVQRAASRQRLGQGASRVASRESAPR